MIIKLPHAKVVTFKYEQTIFYLLYNDGWKLYGPYYSKFAAPESMAAAVVV